MKRVTVVISAVVALLAGLTVSAHAMGFYSPPAQPNCAPQSMYVKKMVPCIKTELVAEVKPCTVTVPVQRVGYRCRRVLVKETPVGRPCAVDPCVRCFPQPSCRVVTQKAPYVYYESQCVPWYNVTYKKVCRKVWRPQVFKVEARPLCR